MPSFDPAFSSEKIFKESCQHQPWSLPDSIIYYISKTPSNSNVYYIKNNKFTKFYLHFNDSISEAYKNQLNAIIDEILQTEIFDYKPPVIKYNGIEPEKLEKMEELYDEH